MANQEQQKQVPAQEKPNEAPTPEKQQESAEANVDVAYEKFKQLLEAGNRTGNPKLVEEAKETFLKVVLAALQIPENKNSSTNRVIRHLAYQAGLDVENVCNRFHKKYKYNEKSDKYEDRELVASREKKEEEEKLQKQTEKIKSVTDLRDNTLVVIESRQADLERMIDDPKIKNREKLSRKVEDLNDTKKKIENLSSEINTNPDQARKTLEDIRENDLQLPRSGPLNDFNQNAQVPADDYLAMREGVNPSPKVKPKVATPEPKPESKKEEKPGDITMAVQAGKELRKRYNDVHNALDGKYKQD